AGGLPPRSRTVDWPAPAGLLAFGPDRDRAAAIGVDAAAVHAGAAVGHGDDPVAVDGDDAAVAAQGRDVGTDHGSRGLGQGLAAETDPGADLVRGRSADEVFAPARRRHRTAGFGPGAAAQHRHVADPAVALQGHA